LGFNVGIYYNIDFRNDDMGLTGGLQYQLHPYKTKYVTELDEISVYEKNLISSISLPIYFKYGRKFYEPMRYISLGAQINYYFGGKVNYEYLNESTDLKIKKSMLSDLSPGFFVGFNYGKINVKFEYTPNLIVKESPIFSENFTDNNGHSKHFISLQTNINIPLNPWTRFPLIHEYPIWIRRLLK
jgi:hypothetical protein